MSKKLEFVKYVESLLSTATEPMNDDAAQYWEAFRITGASDEKKQFTANGKLILKFLQKNTVSELWTAKNIAEELGISSRSVSGSIRKLVSDNYVEKLGENPIIYKITENGKNINLEGEN